MLSRSRALWVFAVVFAVALAVRLMAVLRGGGLYGFVGYDGSVYYAAAAGVASGLLPYRDFLLLHPPGVVLALLPFAALGRLVGDPDAFALARLTWIALGAVNAALVSSLLRRYGAWPALAGGLGYALYVPAIYTERNTALEVIGSACLLLALRLLTRTDPGPGVGPDVGRRALLVAGLLLGVSTGTKIWGTALVLALLVWCVALMGARRALLLLAGAVGGAVLVCLPFFLAAPGAMWQMVVLDQLGRRRVDAGPVERLVDIAGLTEVLAGPDSLLLVAGCTVVVAALVVLAATTSLGRLALLLLAVMTALLVLSPSWSVRYAGLAAPPAALVLGCAVAALEQRFPRRRAVATVLVAAGLTGYAAVSLPRLDFGRPLPASALRPVLAAAGGCVTTDDPTVLIETGTLRTNLDAGCPLVVDMSGYSYHLQPSASRRITRVRNEQWQEFVRGYLASGEVTMVIRFQQNPGFDRRTKALVASWPVVGGTRRYPVRDPTPESTTPGR